MRVLYLINHAGKGGSEKYVEMLANGLIKKGGTPFLAYNEKGLLVDKLTKMGVKCIKLKMTNPYDINAAIKLAAVCKKLEINIIHAQFPRENYIAVLAKAFGGPRVIYTSHINLANTLPWKFTNYFFTRQNSAIIAVCTSVKDLLVQNRYPKNKIHIIFNGVSTNNSFSSENIGKQPSPFVFTTLARLSYEKGLMFLLESVKALVQEFNPNFMLKIAGDGSMEEELRGYIRLNNLQDHVQLPGYVANTKELLSQSHAYINSSQSEALSFAILEAMSQGLPVIATKVGGNVDIIEKGKCGILIEYGKPKQMAEAMNSIINDHNLYNRYSENAISAIRDTFNIEKVFEQTYNLYEICNIRRAEST